LSTLIYTEPRVINMS